MASLDRLRSRDSEAGGAAAALSVLDELLIQDTSDVEQFICHDEKLSELVGEKAAAYAKAMLSPAASAIFRAPRGFSYNHVGTR